MKKWQAGCLAALGGGVVPAVFSSAFGNDLASLHTRLAFEYVRMGQLPQALNAAGRAVALAPGFAPAWLARAFVQSALSLDQPAELDYRQALILLPASGEANNNFGWFLCQRGRQIEGRHFLEAALRDPLYPSREVVYVNLGRCTPRTAPYAERAAHFLAAVRLNPGYGPALKAMAALCHEWGKVKQASYYYGRLLEKTVMLDADDLLLGVRISRMSGDRVRETDYAERLKNHFPDSRETEELLSGI